MTNSKMTTFQRWTLVFMTASLVLSSVAVFWGLQAAIDTSVMQKLGHYQKCGSNRSNDLLNPAGVTDITCRLIIEIYQPHLIFKNIPEGFDPADVWIVFGQGAKSTATSVDTYLAGATLIQEVYMTAGEMRGYCSDPDPTDTYYRRFYFVMDELPALMVNTVYALWCDFYNADSEYFTDFEVLAYWEGFAGGSDMLPPRPRIIEQPLLTLQAIDNSQQLEVQIDAGFDTTNCDYISFFELETDTYYTPSPTPTPPPPGDEGTGEEGNFIDGLWNSGDPFFDNLKEQFSINAMVSYSILIFIIIAIILLIFAIIMFVMWKKKKE